MPVKQAHFLADDSIKTEDVVIKTEGIVIKTEGVVIKTACTVALCALPRYVR